MNLCVCRGKHEHWKPGSIIKCISCSAKHLIVRRNNKGRTWVLDRIILPSADSSPVLFAEYGRPMVGSGGNVCLLMPYSPLGSLACGSEPVAPFSVALEALDNGVENKYRSVRCLCNVKPGLFNPGERWAMINFQFKSQVKNMRENKPMDFPHGL